MLGDFDLQWAAEAIRNAQGVIEWETVSLETGTFDAGGADVYIHGNVTQGAVIRNAGSVLINGTLSGSERWPCRIEVSGDVVVLGGGSRASVSGNSIRIGGSIGGCKLKARAGLEAGADVSESQIEVGDFSPERRRLEALKETIVRARRDEEAIERQIRLEERRMYNQMATTRISMNISLGNMIVHKRKRITIDLTLFYKTIGDKPEHLVDQALMEFFAKGIVGMMTQVNMQFLQQQKNRQTIFKGVVSKLKDLILLTREFDIQKQKLQDLEAERDGLIEALADRTCPVHIRGSVQPDVEFRFVGPELDRLEDGEVFVGMQVAKLQVTGSGIQETDVDGLVSEEAPETLSGLWFGLQEGRVARATLGAPLEESVK